MPTPKRTVLMLGTLSMEILPGYVALLGSHLLLAARLSYGSFYVLCGASLVGLLVGQRLCGPNGGRRLRGACVSVGSVTAVALASPYFLNFASFCTCILFAALAYWRGISATRRDSAVEHVQGRFVFGLVLLVVGYVSASETHGQGFHGAWQVSAVMGCASVAIGLCTLATVRAEREESTAGQQAVILAAGFPVAVLFLLSVAAVVLVSSGTGAHAAALAHPTGNGLGAFIENVVRAIFDPIFRLVQFSHTHLHPKPIHPPRFFRHARPPITPPPKHLRSGGLMWVRLLGIATGLLVLIAAAYVLWKALPRFIFSRRRQLRKHAQTDLQAPQNFWAAVRDWLRTLFGKARVRINQSVRSTRRRLFARGLPPDPVRRLYVQLLRRAGKAGLPRPPDITPKEYQVRLAQRWPSGATHFEALTDAYMLRRYGDNPVEADHVAVLRRHLRDIRAVVRSDSARA